MFIAFVSEVYQIDEVPVLARERESVANWLKQWTCESNFEQLVIHDDDPGNLPKNIQVFATEMSKMAKIHGFAPQNLELRIRVKNVRDNRFYGGTGGDRVFRVTCK